MQKNNNCTYLPVSPFGLRRRTTLPRLHRSLFLIVHQSHSRIKTPPRRRIHQRRPRARPVRIIVVGGGGGGEGPRPRSSRSEPPQRRGGIRRAIGPQPELAGATQAARILLLAIVQLEDALGLLPAKEALVRWRCVAYGAEVGRVGLHLGVAAAEEDVGGSAHGFSAWLYFEWEGEGGKDVYLQLVQFFTQRKGEESPAFLVC